MLKMIFWLGKSSFCQPAGLGLG